MADVKGFFDRAGKLSTGERAELRRSCAKPLSEADGKAMMAFYSCLPRDVPQSQEDRWFAALCFSCLWEAGQPAYAPEAVINRLAQVSDSMSHRLAGLLDIPWEPDGCLQEKLARLMKLAKSKGYAMDCSLLLEDLLWWNSKNQSVQRKWARAMYQNLKEE